MYANWPAAWGMSQAWSGGAGCGQRAAWPAAAGGAYTGGCSATPSRSLTEAATGHGEVRYEDADSAAAALQSLNGVALNGHPLMIALDPASKDKTKLIITGLPADIQWQELKDHFKQMPNLAFVDVKGRSGETLVGEVRYDSSAAAQQAMHMLQGTEMGFGCKVSISMDASSKDGTKLIVTGIPPGSGWQELKDHFNQAGQVAYAGVVGKNTSQSIGEVRYDNPEHAKVALNMLNGSLLRGCAISVQPAHNSPDGSKLMVHGLGPGTEWQELKDHFAQIGKVAFAQVNGNKKGGGGGGGGANAFGGWPMKMAGGCGPYSGAGGKGVNMMPVMMMVPMGPDGQPMPGKGGQPVAWGWENMPSMGGYGKA